MFYRGILMVRIIVKLIKQVIMAYLIIYGLNVMLSGLNFYIPLNLITISTVSLLVSPGLLCLVTMFLVLK